MPKKQTTINKGEIGEISIIRHLMSNYPQYNVFRPIIDDGQGVDIIVERRKKEFLRVQVKTITDMKTATSIEVRLHKYVKKDLIDIVAVYYTDKDMICFVLYKDQTTINLALKPSRNKQHKNRHYFYQYMEFPYE